MPHVIIPANTQYHKSHVYETTAKNENIQNLKNVTIYNNY